MVRLIPIAEAAKKRDALITEVMAAVNTAKVGQTSYTGHQWIELYNNLPVEITVKLSTKEGRPASDADQCYRNSVRPSQ